MRTGTRDRGILPHPHTQLKGDLGVRAADSRVTRRVGWR